jgi:hypothetical protein
LFQSKHFKRPHSQIIKNAKNTIYNAATQCCPMPVRTHVRGVRFRMMSQLVANLKTTIYDAVTQRRPKLDYVQLRDINARHLTIAN